MTKSTLKFNHIVYRRSSQVISSRKPQTEGTISGRVAGGKRLHRDTQKVSTAWLYWPLIVLQGDGDAATGTTNCNDNDKKGKETKNNEIDCVDGGQRNDKRKQLDNPEDTKP